VVVVVVVVVVVELAALAVLEGAAGFVVTVRVTTGGGANRFSQPATARSIMATTAMCAADLPVRIPNISFPAASRAIKANLAANISVILAWCGGYSWN